MEASNPRQVSSYGVGDEGSAGPPDLVGFGDSKSVVKFPGIEHKIPTFADAKIQLILFSDLTILYQHFKAAVWRSPVTVYNFHRSIRYTLEIWRGLLASDINREHIENLQAEIYRTQPTESWVTLVRSYMNGVFNFAHERGYVLRNPIDKVSWPKRKIIITRKYKDFSKKEYLDLIGACTRKPVSKFITLACYTGLRKGTIYALTCDMLQDGFLNIPASIVKQGIELRIPLAKPVIKALGKLGNPSDPLIPGLPAPTQINFILRQVARVANLDPSVVYPHNFRRTWCAWMVKAGASREEVMRIQGWSDASVLLKHYWPGVSDQRAQEILRRL